ncbi:MAG: ABC transporter permease [Candidatus Saccharibacteria bacterium]|nr:ABC transporter permease [Pseudorhodobacter sp.]
MAKAKQGQFLGSEAAYGLGLVSPTAIYALLLLAAPLAFILIASFLTDGYLSIIPKFQLCNYFGECASYKVVDGALVETQKYRGAWTDPVLFSVMVRSLVVSLLVTFATVALAYPMAYFISFNVAPSKKGIWLFLITIPFWTSYVIRVFMWNAILGFSGVINSALIGIGLIDTPLNMTFNLQAMVITLAHSFAPFAILPIYVALEKIDRSLLEAGQDLGESRFATFLRVTLPLSMSGVVAAVLIVFIPTIGDYVTPKLVGGAKYPMIANAIEVLMLKGDNKPLGSAIAVSAMMIVGLISVVFLYANRRYLRGPK